MSTQPLFAIAGLPTEEPPTKTTETRYYAGRIRLHNPRWSRLKHRFIGTDRDGTDHPVDRTIEYNPDGTKHQCNAACKHAHGPDCECSCGGRNHGINA